MEEWAIATRSSSVVNESPQHTLRVVATLGDFNLNLERILWQKHLLLMDRGKCKSGLPVIMIHTSFLLQMSKILQ